MSEVAIINEINEGLVKKIPKGSIVALVTPFDKYGKVDCKKIKQLVAWHEQNGTAGIVVFGTTGESPTLTHKEKLLVLETCLSAVKNDTFVFAGSGSNDTFKAVEDTREYGRLGADGLLVVSPYYNKTNDDGMLKHFLAVAEASVKPIVLYNVPSRTGCCISTSVLDKLSKHENVVGIKEASGNLAYASKVATFAKENFALYCGNDDIILPYLSLGARGVISVWANVMPSVVAELVKSWFLGKVNKAKKIQLHYLEFIDLLFCQPNPIPVKAVLNILGFGVGLPRLPLGQLTKKEKQRLKQALVELGEIK